MMMTRKRRLTVMMKWSREELQVFNPTGNCRGLNGRFCLCLRLCLYICLCVHHVHVKASPWVKTISIQPAFSVFISIIIAWHCWTLWLSWAGNREWEIMYSNRREIMSSYGAISKWPSGKWLPRPQKWMKKNSDKFSWDLGIWCHRLGRFFAPSDPSSQWKIDSPKIFQPQGGRHSWLRISQPSRLGYPHPRSAACLPLQNQKTQHMASHEADEAGACFDALIYLFTQIFWNLYKIY